MIKNRFWREPLLHFVIVSGFLYGLYNMVSSDDENGGDTITVSQPQLLNYLQYRAKAFRPDFFNNVLNEMPEDEYVALVRDFIDEEILYRQAQSYGLERGDDVIRQRLIQKARFLLDSEVVETEPEKEMLLEHFQQHANRYSDPERVTFTHVFFDRKIHGKDAELLAREAVADFNKEQVDFVDAPAYGDRFPYLINYVDRTEEFVASHFDPAMAAELMKKEVSGAEWIGPFQSVHGWHAVLLVGKKPRQQPQFDEVAESVKEAFLEERRIKLRKDVLERLRSQYSIKLDIDRDLSIETG